MVLLQGSRLPVLGVLLIVGVAACTSTNLIVLQLIVLGLGLVVFLSCFHVDHFVAAVIFLVLILVVRRHDVREIRVLIVHIAFSR